jgi:hypothetical protein
VKKAIPVVVLALLLASQLLLVGYDVVSSEPNTDIVTSLQDVPQLTGTIAIEQVLPQATDVALAWRSDAVLVRAMMQVDWPQDGSVTPVGELPPGGWVLLGFLSGQDLLTMRIERGGGLIVQQAVTPLGKEEAAAYLANQADLTQAKQSSADAAIAFDIANGRAFRDACPERRGQSFIQSQRSPISGEWTWTVTYMNRRQNDPTEYMSGEMNWVTGTIANLQNEDAPCDPISS